MKKDYELDYYLCDLDANQEERRCVHMWIRDGHWIDENDYEYENMDFLTAIHHTVPAYAGYTDSYYDPRTQAYIRSMKPTDAEKRKMRKHRRSGARFAGTFFGNEEVVDYLTYLREKDDYADAEFESCFGDYIAKYGAGFLMKNNLAGRFIQYLEKQGIMNQTDSDDELPF